MPCSDGDLCNGEELCAAGVCEAPATLDCDDANACTADACDGISGCSHAGIPGCAAAVPVLPEAGRTFLILALVLTSSLALMLRRPGQP